MEEHRLSLVPEKTKAVIRKWGPNQGCISFMLNGVRTLRTKEDPQVLRRYNR